MEIPAIIVSNVKRAMSLLAQSFYDYPQNELQILALTGTKGKTTSAYFAKSILDEMNGQKQLCFLQQKQLLMGKISSNLS